MSELQLLLARNGVRIGALYAGGQYPGPDDVALRFGLRPLGNSWQEIDRPRAIHILRALLKRDLAYGCDADSAPLAKDVSVDFIQAFAEGSRFYTNAVWPACAGGEVDAASLQSWTPATDSRFDSGILVLHEHRVGVYWLEDED